jgi:hypothetical protein
MNPHREIETMKTIEQAKKALFIPTQDADYILHPLAQQLRAAGVPKRTAEKALKVAAQRALRLAAAEAGVPSRLVARLAADVARHLAA